MKFFEVFSQLQVEKRLENHFSDVEVDSIRASKNGDTVLVIMDSDKVLRPTYLNLLKAELDRQVFSELQKNTEFSISYHLDCGNDLERGYQMCREAIVEELHLHSHLDAQLLEHPEVSFSENVIQFTFEENYLAKVREANIIITVTNRIKEYTGIDCTVRIAYKEPENVADNRQETFDYEEFLAARAKLRAMAEEKKRKDEDGGLPKDLVKKKPETPKVEKPANGGEKTYVKKKLPEDPDVFYGRAFDGDIIQISDIVDEIGEVVIRGKIITCEEKELKSGKFMLTVGVTDFTDTINLKLFLKKEDYEAIGGDLQPGKFVKAKGLALYDKFDHELAISSIIGVRREKDYTIKRFDRAEVKRVELHCHTQMSEMDAVVDTGVLVNTCFNWGMPGIAITDHGVVQSFVDAFHAIDKKKFKDDPEKMERFKNFKIIYGCEGYIIDDEGMTKPDGTPFDPELDKEELRKQKYNHIILLAKNDIGRINLYRLVSLSHLEYFNRRPKIPKSILRKYREGIIIGSACEQGELYQAILHNKPEEEIKRISDFYDYYEIQPIGNNAFMLRDDEKFPHIQTEQDLIELNKKIVYLAEEHDKLCVATCDVHFLNPEDEVYRRIIMAGKGFKDADMQAPLYLRTTDEMLDEFKYLPKEKAFEIVVTNTNRICDMIEKIEPVRPDKCPPVIENSDQQLRDICYNTAHDWYGENLPVQVVSRLDKELNSIISNGYAVMYIIAERLVKHSNDEGYMVGSRGSVGSSFVATMSGITEVNPLVAHYRCPKCRWYDFESDEVKAYEQLSGYDLPDRECPHCGTPLIKDGQNIPFETFLGFYGNKEPDIDLNFSGDNQASAHQYTEVLFGKGHTFRAGTVGTLADKTMEGYVRKYYEERDVYKRRAEITRVALGGVGVKRTTGQHPGGIVVLPHGEDINSFTPVQHPANDMTTPTITTHFDYHKIDQNLLKLDILGHDDPTMIRMLENITGVDAKQIPMNDPGVLELFRSTESLGISPEDIDGTDLGSLGIPELGTNFVMQMLRDTKPASFSDMIRISGLSHGTDVWTNNTQDLIREGKCTLGNAVCTRDDIMVYLIHMGLESGLAFDIMEKVRKGTVAKGKCAEWPEWKEKMLAHDVPDWYIGACEKIKYMFPKAHACAYVMMAFRIAWFKVHKPLAYYAAYFSIRAKAFSYELMCLGKEKLRINYNEIKRKIASHSASPKEEEQFGDMHIVMEMYARGYDFAPVDLYKSQAKYFQVLDEKRLLPSFVSIDGLGENAALAIEEGIKNMTEPFLSKEDFGQRCHVGASIVSLLSDLGILGDLQDSNQMSFANLLTFDS